MPAGTLERSHKVARPDPADRAHLPALDGIRGIAILAVVSFHVAVVASHGAVWSYRTSPPAYSWPFFAGSIGVDVFFVLSGLLVFRSWQSLRARHSDDWLRTIVEFARRRGRRILPPYWAALVVLVAWRAPEWLSTSRGWRNITLFTSLNQFMDPSLPNDLNTVTWSLTTETHFYIALPVLALVFIRYGMRRTIALLLLSTVAWRLAVGGTGGEAEWIFGRVDQFAAGMGAATLISDHRAGRTSALLSWLRRRYTRWILGAGLAGLALVHGALRLRAKPLAFLAVLHPLAGLMIAGLLVSILCGRRIRVLHSRVLGWLGLVSYSLYLWHWPLLAEGTARWGSAPVVLAAALASAVVLSVLSYALLERPFVRTGATDRQRDVGISTEATMANSPWFASSGSALAVPAGNST
jgi:peptidoglycan/LPS O-acetylase OafA/YrhL